MGASFLSKPVTEKHSSNEEDKKLKCGISSMQGWRLDQEDAHNCKLDFDIDTAFFAVYDGHGGREVAEYCSQKLPEFIKNTAAYKAGDIERALVEGFLEFDQTLCTPEVVEELKRLQKLVDENGEDESDVEENVKNLYEEAAMPIEEVIKKYKKSVNESDEKINVLVPRRKKETNEACSSSTTSEPISSSQDASSSSASESKDTNEAQCKEMANESDSNLNGTTNSLPDSSDAKEPPAVESTNESSTSTQNGEVPEDQSKEDVCSSTSQEQTDSVKGKGKSILKKTDPPTNKRNMRTRIVKEVYKALLELDEESEDEEDEPFEGPNGIETSSDEDEDGINPHIEEADSEEGSGEEDSEDEVNEEEDEEECEDEEEDLDSLEPGYKSGCTAVVGILKGNDLYVANIGDSRCLVCREGKVVEMSEDHKPEKDIELKRIEKAGGNVNSDYRINNGLNLSRAFGDFSYKQNKTLSDREQMVIALPDIRKLTIEAGKDEFMIFACDGIWNSMKNEEVVDFLRPKVLSCKEDENLSKPVEELIDQCFDPETAFGDTGNDNMTAIIIKFKSNKPNLKRSASPAPPDSHSSKIPKTEESHECTDTTVA